MVYHLGMQCRDFISSSNRRCGFLPVRDDRCCCWCFSCVSSSFLLTLPLSLPLSLFLFLSMPMSFFGFLEGFFFLFYLDMSLSWLLVDAAVVLSFFVLPDKPSMPFLGAVDGPSLPFSVADQLVRPACFSIPWPLFPDLGIVNFTELV